jgi:hypothetical protein
MSASHCWRFKTSARDRTGLADESALNAGAALTNSNIKVEGCGSESLQGDVQFADVMERMGAKVEWKQTSIRIKGEPMAVYCCVLSCCSCCH